MQWRRAIVWRASLKSMPFHCTLHGAMVAPSVDIPLRDRLPLLRFCPLPAFRGSVPGARVILAKHERVFSKALKRDALIAELHEANADDFTRIPTDDDVGANPEGE